MAAAITPVRSADPPGTVRLLDADPELARDLDPTAWAEAQRLAVVRHVELGPGELSLDPRRPPLLLLAGAVLRQTWVGGHAAAELLGPGDVVHGHGVGDSVVVERVEWTVHLPVRAAVLDERMGAITRRWPTIGARMADRLSEQHARTGTLAAITQLPRVDLRVLGLLWHLAERWGRVTPEGLLLPMRLTHRTIGRLIGAQRPTVTLAVGQLVAVGAIKGPQPGGGWVLKVGPDGEHRPAWGLATAP